MVVTRQSLSTSYKLVVAEGSKGNEVEVGVGLVCCICTLRAIKVALKTGHEGPEQMCWSGTRGLTWTLITPSPGRPRIHGQ